MNNAAQPTTFIARASCTSTAISTATKISVSSISTTRRRIGIQAARSRHHFRIAAVSPTDEQRTGGVAAAAPAFMDERSEAMPETAVNECCDSAVKGITTHRIQNVGKSTNIAWHECPVGKTERQKLLNQKGCVIWITGLSGSGKSTLACTLSRELHYRGYLTYVLDGDNVRHGLNKDLSFKAEDRAENIRRVGEVAKLFADAGIICIASLISPYRRDRNACRAMVPDSSFIEVFMDIPLEVCEARDPKGLYKLARAGKIKGFTGIDDPYEPPLASEIVIQPKDGKCPSPIAMAERIILFLDKNEFLQA